MTLVKQTAKGVTTSMYINEDSVEQATRDSITLIGGEYIPVDDVDELLHRIDANKTGFVVSGNKYGLHIEPAADNVGIRASTLEEAKEIARLIGYTTYFSCGIKGDILLWEGTKNERI